MRIQNNIMAINTHRQYGKAINSVSGSAEKLASGYRINRAGDDPAGLAISEKMRAQIRGLTMASKNSQDAVSLVQTGEGALQETHNILQRMRELAVQSASDTNEQSVDRGALQEEFEQLRKEINDIASKTRFNDQNIIDGTFQKWTRSIDTASTTEEFLSDSKLKTISVDRAQAGTYALMVSLYEATPAEVIPGQQVTAEIYSSSATIEDIVGGGGDSFEGNALIENITFNGLQTDAHNGNVYTLKIEGADLTDMSFSLLDTKGATVARINGTDTSTWAPGGTYSVSFEGVGSISFTVADGDDVRVTPTGLQGISQTKLKFAEGITQETIPAQPAYMELFINGEMCKLYKGDTVANFPQNGIAFEFYALSDADFSESEPPEVYPFGLEPNNEPVSIGVGQVFGAPLIVQTGANMGDEMGINIDAMNARMLGIEYSNIATQSSASKAIDEVNRAINIVSSQRAALGALQNRLNYKINNLDTSAENLTAAEGRIRDADMAKEMTEFTKNNILVQASTAMLAQANSAPQNVLSLLG